ncbi:uncharacterized protein LOC143191280 [Rhynchophorus ferrugineus]|uniref:DUF4485 domain-containing protein n=1 Tax=Rhynchophorus ferrugineus TaxID=354439 RepID=A0A834MLY4_RHYFE|nr:hypothetical protein GWI33_011704 [Rhynchophorus ferrugineus]
MSDPIIALNDHFRYNHRMAKALQQFLTPPERKMIQLWLDKLEFMNKNLEQMITRSDYMWFILLMLQNRRVREPFSKLPPAHIPALKKFVPLHVYEEVLISNEPNMIYLNRKSSSDILNVKEKRGRGTSCSSLE